MKLIDNIYVLELPIGQGEKENFIYLTLINDDEQGLTLVDTGYPGQFELLVKAMNKEGFVMKDLQYIVLTHQDIDHVGNVKEIIKQVPDVKVICYKEEEPYINGTKSPTKLMTLGKKLADVPEQVKALYEGMKRFFENNKVNVDITVQDNENLPCAKAAKVIFTPGHTPGHMSLYIEKYNLLIAGDLLDIREGEIAKMSEEFNDDQGKYIASLNKIKGLHIKTVISYHGGIKTID